MQAAALLRAVSHGPTPGPAPNRVPFGKHLAEGVRVAVTRPVLRVVLAFVVVTGVGEAVVAALMAPFVRDVLGGSARSYGVILSAQAVGGVGGGLLASAAGHRFTPRLLLGAGAIAFGLLDLVLFLYPLAYAATWPAVALMVAVGLSAALAMAGLVTLVQLSTEDDNRGRVVGAATAPAPCTSTTS